MSATVAPLLLVWWSAALCGATTEPPSAAEADPHACQADSLELMVTRIATSAVAPTVARLSASVDGVQAQLTQLTASADSARAQQTARHAALTGQLAGVETRLESALGAVRSQLTACLEGGAGRQPAPARDCSDLPAGAVSGVHLLLPGLRQPVPGYCDTETAGGGWTVIQRRDDIQPRQDFFLGWQDYKWGLGRLDAEFWWGLEHIWLMTYQLDRQYELRIDIEDFDGQKRYALYQDFSVSSEGDGYRLKVSNYSGDSGDSFGNLSGMRFSTKDKDQDTLNGSCAQKFKGGWWYKDCHSSNLNGLYLSGNHTSYADGINWYAWKGHHYSFKAVEMKIRPSKKL